MEVDCECPDAWREFRRAFEELYKSRELIGHYARRTYDRRSQAGWLRILTMEEEAEEG
jgi:hypothetical protein